MPQLSPEAWEHLAEDYERLGSRKAVAELYGVSVSAVQRQMNRRGITVRSQVRFPPSFWDHLEEDYQRLGSRKAVAELYGCSEGLVQRWLRRKGITPQPRHARMVALQKSPEGRQAARERLLRRTTEGRPLTRPTTLETLCAKALASVGLRFEFQYRVGDFLVDFKLRDYPIVIEADGWQHRLKEHQMRDAERDAILRSQGLTVFRFTGVQLHRSAQACVAFAMDYIRMQHGQCAIAPYTLTPDWGALTGEKNPAWGKPRSPESRRKQSESRKRRYQEDPDFRARMREVSTLSSRTPERRAKMREASKGNQNHKGHFKHPRS